MTGLRRVIETIGKVPTACKLLHVRCRVGRRGETLSLVKECEHLSIIRGRSSCPL